MTWLDNLLDRLAAKSHLGYSQKGPPFTEPTAWAAMALLAHERRQEAIALLERLKEQQLEDGGLGVAPDQPIPCWPTSLAVLAWLAGEPASALPITERRYRVPIDRAVQRMLSIAGRALPRPDTRSHDTTLIGWPWVEGTHSWSEPTAFHVLALKAAGRGADPRVREGVRVLVDRLLPQGGSNYGNTFVLGQRLRPHLQPTGIALMALAGEPDDDGRVARSIEYLQLQLTAETSSASLAYALLGLEAQGAPLKSSLDWLELAYRRTLERDAPPYQLALLALAAAGRRAAPISLLRGAFG